VYDYEITGKHRLLGVVNTTAEKLKEAAGTCTGREKGL
jgi:hypothetical protein